MEPTDRPTAWERIGPLRGGLLLVVLAALVLIASVRVLESGLALVVGVPSVDGLPGRVSVCGRDYRRAPGGPLDLLTLDALRATGTDPVVVLPLPIQPCVDGACTRVATDGPCATVVFVRVVADRYAAYALSGGP